MVWKSDFLVPLAFGALGLRAFPELTGSVSLPLACPARVDPCGCGSILAVSGKLRSPSDGRRRTEHRHL